MHLFPKETREVLGSLRSVLFETTKRNRWLLLGTVILWSFLGLLGVAFPIVSSCLISSIQKDVGQQMLSFIMIVWTVINASLGPFNAWCWDFAWNITHHLIRFYNDRMSIANLENLFKRPMLVAEGEQSDKVIATISTAREHIAEILHRIGQACSAGISFAIATVILLKEEPTYAAILFAFMLLSIWIKSWIEFKYNPDSELDQMRIKMRAEETDHLNNLVNIGMLGREKEILGDVEKKLADNRWRTLKVSMKADLMRSSNYIISIVSNVIITLLAVVEALKTGDVARLILLTGMAKTMASEGAPLSFFVGTVVSQTKAYQKAMDTLEYDHKLDLKTGRDRMIDGGKIELKHVTFSYPDSIEPVLKDLSLKIKQGDRVAIIGNSGMGKSTLINVMQHAYEIQSGEVIINGKNVQKVNRHSLKAVITYLNQHAVFWSQKNIKENLLMFNPKATEVELYQALNAANLLEEITHKEKGIEAKVTALSAGQKQRLSLARALLRHTPIIIMDEPTANLDTHAQTKVLEGIKNLSKVKGHKPTVVFASNVPAEIASANRILLLENGQIVEDGNPKKLMDNPDSKVYKRLKKYAALFKGE